MFKLRGENFITRANIMKIFLTLIMSKLYETWDSNKIESWFISWEAKTLNKEQKKVLSFKVWRCTSMLAWDVNPEVETWDSEQVRELILHAVRWKLYNRNKSKSEAIQFGELYSGLILYFIYTSTRDIDAQSWKFENQNKRSRTDIAERWKLFLWINQDLML